MHACLAGKANRALARERNGGDANVWGVFMASKQTFVVRRRASRWPDPARRGKTNERGHAGLVWWARRLVSAPGARRVGQSRHAGTEQRARRLARILW